MYDFAYIDPELNRTGQSSPPAGGPKNETPRRGSDGAKTHKATFSRLRRFSVKVNNHF